jgi:hypothetical protein
MISARLLAVVAATVGLGAAGAPVTGCGEVDDAPSRAYEPARLEAIEGTDVKRVRLTAEAVGRVGIRTATVERRGRRTALSYEALIYGADGTTFVYTVSGPGSFVREAVEVARVEGRMAELFAGPRAGVQVVTAGAAEVYGTEFEVGH